mgnify:FL=1|jgi:hypothetical protein
MKGIATASLVLISLSLSGCVTTQDLRAKPALIDVSSAKASRAIAACITEKWEASGVFGMSMDVDNTVLADGYAVSIKNGEVVQMLADVRDAGTGSTTKFYKPGFVAATGKFENAVRDCQ